jgi:hypothetical protein
MKPFMTYDRFIKREFGGFRSLVKEHRQNLVNVEMSDVRLRDNRLLDIEHSTLDINYFAEAILLSFNQSISSETVRRQSHGKGDA